MRPIARKGFKTTSPFPVPRPVDRFCELAAYILRLGQRQWSDPETFTIVKHTLAGELRALARELER